MTNPPQKNKKLLDSFVRYCEKNPSERFWQALRNWAEVPFLLAGRSIDIGEKTTFPNPHDTFYWEKKNEL